MNPEVPWSLLSLFEASRFLSLHPFDEGVAELSGDGEQISIRSTLVETSWSPGVEVIRSYLSSDAWSIPAISAAKLVLGGLGAERLAPEGATFRLAVEGDSLRGEVEHDGLTSNIVVPPPTFADRLITDELGLLIEQQMPGAQVLQRALDQELTGITRWDWAGDAGELGMLRVLLPSGAREIPAFVLGSFLRSASNFRWAWANPTVPRASSEQAALLRDQSVEPGLGALRRGAFHCDEQFARLLACTAGARLGVRAVWPAGARDLLTYFAIPAVGRN